MKKISIVFLLVSLLCSCSESTEVKKDYAIDLTFVSVNNEKVQFKVANVEGLSEDYMSNFPIDMTTKIIGPLAPIDKGLFKTISNDLNSIIIKIILINATPLKFKGKYDIKNSKDYNKFNEELSSKAKEAFNILRINGETHGIVSYDKFLEYVLKLQE